jgi:hypothetical protein
MTDSRVAQLLDDLRLTNEPMHRLMRQARDLIHASVKGLDEEVKYGGILFSRPTAFCGLFAHTAHVSLEFGQGAVLHDAHAVLEGQGKFRRHIKLRQAEDMQHKHVAHYVRLAAQQ